MSTSTGDASEDILAIARKVLLREAEAIADLAPALDDSFVSAVDLILQCRGKVIVTAVGKSGHIGRKVAATLASTGTAAFFVHPTEAMHGDLGMISDRDVVIAISHTGATAEVLQLVPVIQKIGAPIITICQSADSPLAKAASVCLKTHVHEEADTLNLAPTASTTATLALGDALAVALLHCRGFKSSDFALFHPAGQLGRSLLRVRDVMVKNRNPTARETTSVQDAITVSKKSNLGAVSIVDDSGHLLGIYTDGDIGRLFDRSRGSDLLRMLEQPVSAVMTKNPKSVDADTPGERAVILMEEQPPTYVLPVIESDGRVAGMVRMHDLIRAGFCFSANDE